MSDSEDDFMSDKFLVDVPVETTYASRRSKAALEGLRKSQAHNARNVPLREREEMRRKEGLSTSLFHQGESSSSRGGIGSSARPSAPPPKETGQSKAMDLMKKMGWNVGESLGRRRSASPERKEKKAEPIRISMWAGRKGLTARSPSPPPLRRLNPDEMTKEAQERLESSAASFRGRVGADFEARDMERKEAKAREILVELDEKRGVKFHPLHAQPSNPDALPEPLLQRLYPDYDKRSRSPSPPVFSTPAPAAPSANSIAASARNLSAAEKLREQMRRDMLAEFAGDQAEVEDEGEQDLRFGVPVEKKEQVEKGESKQKVEADSGEEPDWDDMVSGTKRVLAMTPTEHFAFLVSQLRHEHFFCFWCGYKYSSWEEMEGPGGCPGEDEDDH